MHPIDSMGIPLSNAVLALMILWLIGTIIWHLWHGWQAKRWEDDLKSQKDFSDYLDTLSKNR